HVAALVHASRPVGLAPAVVAGETGLVDLGRLQTLEGGGLVLVPLHPGLGVVGGAGVAALAALLDAGVLAVHEGVREDRLVAGLAVVDVEDFDVGGLGACGGLESSARVVGASGSRGR